MKRWLNVFTLGLCSLLLLIAVSTPSAEFLVDIESGMVFSGYNDVQVPRETGTNFSLSEDLSADPEVFFRLRLSYRFAERHTISIFAAPLRLNASGTVDIPIIFEGVEFPAGNELVALYRFDSYRATYRYRFLKKEKLWGGLGVTAKVRDAAISVESGNLVAEKTNTGFVPLINWSVNWKFSSTVSLLFEGDALAAPQGRAEDIFLGLAYQPIRQVSLKTGYRIIEGGADVEEVYNFTLLHFIVVGFVAEF